MAVRALVIDANILIRATLGIRARNIIKTYSSMVALCVPEPAWHDAEKHVALLAAKRHGDPEKLLRVLRLIADLVQVAGEDTYLDFAPEARRRLARRDPDDWPILACALALDCPIWTEDADFFGCGVATWTSDRVVTYLSAG